MRAVLPLAKGQLAWDASLTTSAIHAGGAHVQSGDATVLVVEDDMVVAKDIERTLVQLGYQVVAVVRSASAALQSIAQKRPDLVLSDISLKGGPDGIQLASIIRDCFGTPVVFLSAHYDDSTLCRVASSGSSGYLMKPFRVPELRASLELALQRHASDTKLQQQALTDELTGLYNRRGFFALGEQQLKVASRSARRVLLVFADINGMKTANDEWGHEAGDRLLLDAVTALRRSFRESDIIARLGGDEFAVLLIDPAFSSHAFVEQRIDASVRQLNAGSDRPYPLSLSLGVCEWNPALQQCLAKLLSDADAKMYEAKVAQRSVAPGS